MSNAPAAYGMRDYSASNPSIQPSLQHSYYSSRQTPPRTPSPTPSEVEELRKPVVDLRSLANPKRFLTKKNLRQYSFVAAPLKLTLTLYFIATAWTITLVVILVLVVLMSLYHRQIVDWLTPVSNKLRKFVLRTCICHSNAEYFVIRLPGGWIIPIAILFIISFPPVRSFYPAFLLSFDCVASNMALAAIVVRS
jgi:hypothetical protein